VLLVWRRRKEELDEMRPLLEKELARLVWSGEAFRTPVTCLFFRDLERPEIKLEKVVARTGFEP
jgi:hypothetical protein